MSDSERVVPLHPAATPDVSPEERARRLQAEVERLASSQMSASERALYLDGTEGYAERYGVDKATLKQMVAAVIKEREKKERIEKAEKQRIEDRAEKKRATEEREQSRLDRQAKKEEKKEGEKKDRERQVGLAAIIKLPKGEHEAKLRQLARQLDVDLEELREELRLLIADEVEARRIEAGEPWPEPVDTKELLDGVLAQLQRYIVIHDEHFAVVCALWVLFAWCHDIATCSPLLVIQSADSGTAKTHLTQAIVWLSPRGLMITEPTGPVLYRTVDRDHPTLGVDDADRLLPRKPDLAHIVNVSYTRGITIPRTEHDVTHYYNPFCPKVLNGIDLLPHLQSATRTRCLAGNLLPKLDDEKVIDFKHAYTDENFSVLRRKAMRWVADNMAVVRDADPALPEGFSRNRQKDNYTLLFAIADLAGGPWPKKIRAAAVALSGNNQPSLGKCLLAKFFEFFVAHGRLLTSQQVEKLLQATEDQEWCNYRGRGRPINKWEVAAQLKPFKVTPVTSTRAASPPTRATTRLGSKKPFSTTSASRCPKTSTNTRSEVARSCAKGKARARRKEAIAVPIRLNPDWGSRKMAVLDGRQCRCLTYDEGSEWIHEIDELPPRVRQRLANSQFNICPTCVAIETRNNANGPPTIGLYFLVITAIERTLDRAERRFNADD